MPNILKPLPLLGVLLVGTLFVAVWADDEEEEWEEPRIHYALSLEAALIESRERHALVLVIFSQDSDNIEPGYLFNDGDSLAEYANENLVVLAAHPRTPPENDPDWEGHLDHIAKQRGFYDQEVRYTDDRLAEVFASNTQR